MDAHVSAPAFVIASNSPRSSNSDNRAICGTAKAASQALTENTLTPPRLRNYKLAAPKDKAEINAKSRANGTEAIKIRAADPAWIRSNAGNIRP